MISPDWFMTGIFDGGYIILFLIIGAIVWANLTR